MDVQNTKGNLFICRLDPSRKTWATARLLREEARQSDIQFRPRGTYLSSIHALVFYNAAPAPMCFLCFECTQDAVIRPRRCRRCLHLSVWHARRRPSVSFHLCLDGTMRDARCGVRCGFDGRLVGRISESGDGDGVSSLTRSFHSQCSLFHLYLSLYHSFDRSIRDTRYSIRSVGRIRLGGHQDVWSSAYYDGEEPCVQEQ